MMSDKSPPNVIFNMINQGKPLFIADLRRYASYQTCCLKDSHNLSCDLKAFLAIVDKNCVNLVCVTERGSTAEQFLSVVADANLPLTKILSTHCIDFDDFFAAYPKCAYLYLGTAFPEQDKGRPVKEYPTDILPQFLYLGSYYDASDESIVSHLGITHMVDATGEKLSKANADKFGITHLPIHIWDIETADIAQHFDAVLAFIDEARSHPDGKILVHCRAGISRSATFVLAYLLKTRHVDSLKSALKLVVGERPFVMPNSAFRHQLRDYEQSVLGLSSFESDEAMTGFISSMNHCWSGLFTKESDFDRIPISFAKQSASTPLDEYPDAETAEKLASAAAKPKKEFLKRGKGVKAAGTGER